MARSMLSLGMLTALASLIAYRSRRFVSGSPPPILAATMMALDSFVHSLPRLASTAALRCLMFAQWEWRAIRNYRGFVFTRPFAAEGRRASSSGRFFGEGSVGFSGSLSLDFGFT